MLTRVNELIDPATGGWDEVLIRDNFWPIDAERILQIPLHQHEMEDYVAWHLTKSGVFSVRSAYYRQWEESYAHMASNPNLSSGSSPHTVWKKLWGLKVPTKVKIFIWRSLHNAIPCYGVLADRHISTMVQCLVCKQHAEDVDHALFGCARAMEIWTILGLHDTISRARVPRKSGAEILEFLLCDLANQKSFMDVVEQLEMIAISCWFIWWQRRLIDKNEEV